MEVDCTDVEDLTRSNHSSLMLMLMLMFNNGTHKVSPVIVKCHRSRGFIKCDQKQKIWELLMVVKVGSSICKRFDIEIPTS